MRVQDQGFGGWFTAPRRQPPKTHTGGVVELIHHVVELYTMMRDDGTVHHRTLGMVLP